MDMKLNNDVKIACLNGELTCMGRGFGAGRVDSPPPPPPTHTHRRLGLLSVLGGSSVVVDLLFVVVPVVGVCNCSICMFCCPLLYFHSSFAIILMGKRNMFALLSMSSWCLVIVV